MPELVPAWERMVELAGGGDVAARMLSLYDPPPLLTGCSQAVFARPEPLLVRNYDFDPTRLEGVIYATELRAPRCSGCATACGACWTGSTTPASPSRSRSAGAARSGPGFAVPLVVRYLLEVCDTTAEALSRPGAAPGPGRLQPHARRPRGRRRDRADRARPAARAGAGRRRDQPPGAASSGPSTRPRSRASSASSGCSSCSATRRRRARVGRVPRRRRCTPAGTPTASARSTPPCTGPPPASVEYVLAGASAGVSRSTRSTRAAARSGCRAEAVEGLLPREAGPAVLGPALGRVVGGGVDRPEALLVLGVVQRRLEERLDEALALHLRVGEQVEHAALALDGADRAGVLRPLDLALVVGRGRDLVELAAAGRARRRRSGTRRSGRAA